MNIFTGAIFCRVREAVAAYYEVYQPLSCAAQVLGRPADFVGNNLHSWANIDPAEVRRMMLAGDEPDEAGAETIDELVAAYSDGERYVWSLWWRGRDGQ